MQLSMNRRAVTGTYALLIRLTTGRRLIVGKLGPRECPARKFPARKFPARKFPEGYYLYLGSALKGLEGHLRPSA